MRVMVRRHRFGTVRAALFGIREVAHLAFGSIRARWARSVSTPPTASIGPTSGMSMRYPFFRPQAAFARLFKARGYSALVALTLALGIGATTTIYSLVEGILADPLEFPASEELAYIWSARPWLDEAEGLIADIQLRDLQENATSFSGMAGFAIVSGRILGAQRPVHTDVGRVSHNFFDVLGVEPMLGREFVEGEDQVGAPWVAVLSHDFWVSEMGADPDVVGQELVVGFPPMEVIGVLPPDFRFPLPPALGPYNEPDIWIPFWHTYSEEGRVVGSSLGEAVVARLAPGVTREEASAELAVLGDREDVEYFESRGFRYWLEAIEENAVRQVRPFLLLLAIGAGLLLLVAVANTATLVLGRGQRRLGEFALRRSLGASVSRLVGESVFDTALLGVVGGAIGLLLAVLAKDLILALMPGDLSTLGPVPIDLQVLGFAVATALVAGLVAGVVPLLQLRRADPGRTLRSEGRVGAGRSRESGRTRGALVVAQVALSVMLLAGSVLLLRTFAQLQSADPGFDRDGALTFSVYLMNDFPTKTDQVAFFDQLTDLLEALPGVERVGGTSALPLSDGTARLPVSRVATPVTVDPESLFLEDDVFVDGRDLGLTDEDPWMMADLNTAQPGYLEAAGIEIVEGRTFSRSDGIDASHVTVVDESLAVSLFDGESPIGHTLWVAGTPREVVGVARRVPVRDLRENAGPQAYLPYAQVRAGRVSMVVRTEGHPNALAETIRDEVAVLNPLVPIADVESVDAILREATAGERFAAILIGVFAVTALTLTGLGVYGVLAFSVGARSREIALRMAVGSTSGRVTRMVVRDGLLLTGVGVAIGIAGVLAAAGAVESLIVGLESSDPIALLAATLVVLTVALTAAAVPAHRAASVDPSSALRDG